LQELKELFAELPELGELELVDRQHQAEYAERIAHAEGEIIKQARLWREALRKQELKEGAHV
jgi:hypothetical protein